ncbi:hypothetical protein DESC_120162 [Desulfosarcina cetonica]|nr:hypothetical protein DESC_120162 [Desulfosarcina cetonica]
MGDHHQCHAHLLVQLHEQGVNQIAVLAVQVPCGFVGQQNIRLHHQRPRQGHALLFTAGKFPGAVFEPRFKAHANQDRFCRFHGRPFFHTADQGRHHGVFQGREFRQQVMELEDETNRAVTETGQLNIVELEHVLARIAELPAIGSIQRAEDVQQGGLADAGCAHDADGLLAVQPERQVVDDLDPGAAVVVRLADGNRLNQRVTVG